MKIIAGIRLMGFRMEGEVTQAGRQAGRLAGGAVATLSTISTLYGPHIPLQRHELSLDS